MKIIKKLPLHVVIIQRLGVLLQSHHVLPHPQHQKTSPPIIHYYHIQKQQVAKKRIKYVNDNHLLPSMPMLVNTSDKSYNWSVLPLPPNATGHRFVAVKRMPGGSQEGKVAGLPDAAKAHIGRIEHNSQLLFCYADFVKVGSPTPPKNNDENNNNNEKPTNIPTSLLHTDPTTVNAFHQRIDDLVPTSTSPNTNPVYNFQCTSSETHAVEWERFSLAVPLYTDPAGKQPHIGLLRWLGHEDGRLFLDRCGRILMVYVTHNDKYPGLREQTVREIRFVDARRILSDLPITVLPTKECLAEDYMYLQEYAPMVDYYLWNEGEKRKNNNQQGKMSIQQEEEDHLKQQYAAEEKVYTQQRHLKEHMNRNINDTIGDNIDIDLDSDDNINQQHLSSASQQQSSFPSDYPFHIQSKHDPALDHEVPIYATEQGYPHPLPGQKFSTFNKNWLYLPAYGQEGISHAHNMALLYHHHVSYNVNTSNNNNNNKNKNNKNNKVKKEKYIEAERAANQQYVNDLHEKYPLVPPHSRLDHNPRAMGIWLNSSPRAVIHGKHVIVGTMDHSRAATNNDSLMKCARNLLTRREFFVGRVIKELNDIHGSGGLLLFRLTRDEYFSSIGVKDNPSFANVVEKYNNEKQKRAEKQQDKDGKNKTGQQQPEEYFYIYVHIVHLRPNGYIPTLVFLDAMTLTQLAILPFESNNLNHGAGSSFLGRGTGYKPPYVTYAHGIFVNKTPWTLDPTEMNSPMVTQSYLLDDQVFAVVQHRDSTNVVQELDMRRMWEKRFQCVSPTFYEEAMIL